MELSNELITKKNKTIFKYKIVVLILVLLLICSVIFGIVVISKKKNSYIIYENIPIVRLNGVESNYYNIASKWEKDGNDYIYKSYPVTLPNSDVIPNIVVVDKKENNKIEFDLPCSCRICYFDLDDSFEIRWENEGWMVAKNKKIEYVNNDSKTLCFSDFVIDNNIMLLITCEYQDLHVIYYYVILR